jgi:hypothetical protein
MMEGREFHPGERLWLCGREVTFVDFYPFEYQRTPGTGIGAAVVQRDGESRTRDVPLWILARDRDESVSRANAVPSQLIDYLDWD